MQITFADARRLAVEVLTTHGMPADHAGIVADHLIDAAAAGHAFAGLPRILALIGHLRDHPPGGEITVHRKGPHSAIIDGGGVNGYVTSLMAVDEAIALARDTGVGVVGVRNTWFSGRLAYYVERAARQGLIAFHTADTMARVAPSGGIDRIFGTNPMAFAFPCQGDPLVVDFGTAKVTWGEVLLRRKLGRPLEPESAVDAAGLSTQDPAAALAGAFLPWGEHRGSGLALVVQVLAILCGGKIVAEDVADSGFFFLVIDPELLMPLEQFRAGVADLVTRIEASRPMPGVERVRVPGRTSIGRRAEAEARGTIEVDDAIHETLLGLCARPRSS
ncbi:Ldh family oxidoreductase [Pseudochelatococcus sp. B33]